MYAWESTPLREIFDFQQIYSVLIGYKKKKIQKRMKSRAKIVNTAFALNYATPFVFDFLLFCTFLHHICPEQI